jgi:ribosomal protein S18 acetylase RimI-like enzyme
MTQPTSIVPLHERDFADFIAYLNDHLSDNGAGDAGYFQPLSRSLSFFPADRETAFRSGLATAVGAKGWRRAWVARSADGRIVGHIDLRAHADGFAEHRCLLGMGVDRSCRKAGLGMALIAHARQWATDAAKLEWIDLQVIGANRAAISLYQRAGFIKAGEVADMFRIDGKSFSYATMSLPLVDESGKAQTPDPA